jgi:hypothetical protein
MFTHDTIHDLASLLSKQGWCKVVGETITWNALEFIKVNNHAYHKIVAMHGLKRHYLHE